MDGRPTRINKYALSKKSVYVWTGPQEDREARLDRQRLRTNHLTPGQRWVPLLVSTIGKYKDGGLHICRKHSLRMQQQKDPRNSKFRHI